MQTYNRKMVENKKSLGGYLDKPVPKAQIKWYVIVGIILLFLFAILPMAHANSVTVQTSLTILPSINIVELYNGDCYNNYCCIESNNVLRCEDG